MRSIKATQNSWGLVAKIFHWGVVALFAYGILKQVKGDVSQLEDKSLLYVEVVFASGSVLMTRRTSASHLEAGGIMKPANGMCQTMWTETCSNSGGLRTPTSSI